MTKKNAGARHGRYNLNLNVKTDRLYLLGRGFVYALIFPMGASRGKVVSAHRQLKTAEGYVKNFAGKNPVEIVEIAKFGLRAG